MWKWLLAVFIVLAVMCGGAGFFVFGTEQGSKIIEQFKPKEKPTEVRLTTVARGDLVRFVSAPGFIEPKTSVEIGAQVSSKIVALPFRAGDAIKKGDVLVRLDADDYIAALDSAKAGLKGEEARLAGTRAELIEAGLERDRTRELFDTKDVSKATLDGIEARYARAAANVQAGEHGVEIARANRTRAEKNLEFCTIVSPMDGILTKLNSEVGEQVLGTFNNIGTIILEVADLGVILMKAKVDEMNIGPVKPGQRARVYLNSYRDEVFSGVVERVQLHRQLDRDGTGYVEAELLVEQRPGFVLRTGVTGNVEIEVETFAGVLKVPSQAVLDRRVDELPKALVDAGTLVDKDKTFARVVFTLDGDKARPKPVQIGSSDLTHTVILAGLAEGDRVIAGPYKVLVGIKNDQKVVEEGTLKKDEKKPETATVNTAGSGNP
ncbi:MAG: efflux RND transporter periplasmic adaptor subunit [Phycisphaerales bacterium]